MTIEKVEEAQPMDSEESHLSPNEKLLNDIRTQRLVSGALLAGLSIAVSPIAALIPRIPGWGIAFFDPVSIFWIIGLLLGGPYVGAICITAGTLGLFFFDPTGIGPMFKFLATLPLMVMAYLAVKTKKPSEGRALSRPELYGVAMIAGYLIRLAIMIPLNLLIIPILMPFLTVNPGWEVYIIEYVLIINTTTSIFDAIVPFVVVHRTPLFENFRMW
ncbi:MAG: hypothetical protein HXY34_03225 [Candidatus Thorarchaeota archaeon]|nr:hypothetical protein [Candidatus Thorarchaeota archaeon]